MPPNQQMQEVLDELEGLQPAPVESLPPEAARKGPTPADAVEKLVAKKGMDPAPESVDRVKDMTLEGPEGSIDIRVYSPASDGPLPVLVYWHGGGWVIADLDTYDATPRALANAARCIVVSAHYRQAPEHPFPAAVEDAYATYEWVREHTAELGGDPNRIAVAGESAGGTWPRSSPRSRRSEEHSRCSSFSSTRSRTTTSTRPRCGRARAPSR